MTCGPHTITMTANQLLHTLHVVFKYISSVGILEQSIWARPREGIWLLCRPARVHRLEGWYDNSVPTRFLALIDCSKMPALKSSCRTRFFRAE